MLIDDQPEPELPLGRRILRTLTWPARRFIDPRLDNVIRTLTESNRDLETRLTGVVHEHSTLLAFLADESRRLMGEMRELTADVGEIRLRVDPLADVVGVRKAMESGIDRLDNELAAFLNHSEGHLGFASERGLWFNLPVTRHYDAGEVTLVGMNERIVEVPYAFRAVAGLPEGSRILDVGSTESTVAISLASLGHVVTAIDLRPYPFSHPNLTVVAEPLETWKPGPDPFDVALCISSIEHFGLGSYEGEKHANADREAIERIARLLKPNGLLVLTVPFGVATTDELQRVYDRARLDQLVEGWRVDDLTFAEQRGPLEWITLQGPPSELHPDVRYVAMITARSVELPK